MCERLPTGERKGTMSDTDDTDDRVDASNSRRSFLGGATGVAVTAVAGLSAVGNTTASEACPTDEIDTIDEQEKGTREEFVIRDGTSYETPVHVIEAPKSGPTAVITGGIHGNEYAGIEAAWDIIDWELESGRLVVIPEANAVAVDQGTYTSSSGDLNQQFPTGRSPTTDHAREIWGIVTGYNADVVVDLHTSMGVYGSRGPEGFGQAIFPTPAGREIARQVRDTVNEAHFGSDGSPYYSYRIGNTLDGRNPRLIHKVGGDLDRPGFLVEATRHDTDLETRVEWLKSNTATILDEMDFDL
jgi:hypothetical protein